MLIIKNVKENYKLKLILILNKKKKYFKKNY